MPEPILRLAVPSPVRRLFDYLPPSADAGPWLAGQRLSVPFGRGRAVAVLVQVAHATDVPAERLRRAERRLDDEPVFTPDALRLLEWALAYYHHPPGEVLAAALPVLLRREGTPEGGSETVWRLTARGAALQPAELGRAPRQRHLLELLKEHSSGVGAEVLGVSGGNWRDAVRRMQQRGWVESLTRPCEPAAGTGGEEPPAPSAAQQEAIEAIRATRGFAPFLLEGVTGSGKTEVYLRAIEAVLARNRQALVLVPEIGLTPQLLERFRRRFAVPIAVLHSGLADGERLCAWQAAREGRAPLVVGTRSAVFVPLARPGLIIVDEEHDGSFKQQDGFRYSARDLAVVRAHQADIPVVLGSATPSLESLHNALDGRYGHLRLPQRAGSAAQPPIRLLDVRRQPLEDGLSPPLRAAIRQHLDAGGQVLLFLNRRGYAPTLLCHECGWVVECRRCDARMTLYAGDRRLRCHHCGTERAVPRQCPQCGSVDLRGVGQGTERLEQALAQHFADVKRVRVDRDTTRRKGALEALFDSVHTGDARLLIGTQMLAKGHHFPQVTLVAIVDADQGLFSADFRAGERLAQLVVQVAGRAGRAERPGEVLIQTHQPDHPLLRALVESDYHAFARAALNERREAGLPPFGHLALLRAEAVDGEAPLAFLDAAKALAGAVPGVELWGPVPAPMERRAGRVRAQLLLRSTTRAPLHRLLDQWLPGVEKLKQARKVRWSLDVDPAEMF